MNQVNSQEECRIARVPDSQESLLSISQCNKSFEISFHPGKSPKWSSIQMFRFKFKEFLKSCSSIFVIQGSCKIIQLMFKKLSPHEFQSVLATALI